MAKNNAKLNFRLTLHQSFELDNIAKALKISKAALLRKMIDKTIDNYYKAIEKNA